MNHRVIYKVIEKVVRSVYVIYLLRHRLMNWKLLQWMALAKHVGSPSRN